MHGSSLLKRKHLATTAVLTLLLSGVGCHQSPKAGKKAHMNLGSTARPSSLLTGFHPASPEGIVVGSGNSYAHVTYQPTVKTIDDSEVRSSLIGVSSDGYVLAFQHAGPNLRALKAGDILFVPNQMARKVLASKTDGDTTYIIAGQAKLSDVVAQGEINIEAPVGFHPARSARLDVPFADRLRNLIEPPVYAQDDSAPASLPYGPNQQTARAAGNADALKSAVQNIAGAVVSGWTVSSWSATPNNGEIDLNLVLVKDVGGFIARITMSGYVTNFDFATNLKLAGGASQVFAGVKNMTGHLHFEWEIAKASPGVWATEDRVKLPGAVSVPLGPLLGGMPLTLDVSSALLIHPALTGGNEYSHGGFNVQWTGGLSFQTSKDNSINGSNTITLEDAVTDDQNVSAVAPNAMVISYCAPRIELKFSVMGDYAKASNYVNGFASKIDNIASNLENALLPASVVQSISQSPLSKVTASNILASNADVYVQFVITEGVTHSSNITPVPCSKQIINMVAQGGGDASLFGLTNGAKTTTDLFHKTYRRWSPDSQFCRDV